MAKMNDGDLVTLARREVDDALGYDSDVLASKRENALLYYQGAVAAPVVANRSTIVSHDVADTVHSLLAQVNPIFQTSMLVFEPTSEEDEGASQMESDAVKWQLENSDGFKLLSQSAHDALLIGNGWLKITVEDTVDVITEQYGELSPEQLQVVMQPTAENQEVEPAETKDGYSIKRSTTTQELKVECIAPEAMLFSQNSGQFSFKDLRMVGERKLFTKSDLLAMGIKQDDVDSIPDSSHDYWPGQRARDGIYTNDDESAKQDAEKLKECFDIQLRVDMNGNGTSELWNIIFGGQVLISKEPSKCIPYATGSPVPMPHRVQGQGMYELMHQVQDGKTQVLRNYMDNLELMNSTRVGALEGAVNMKDLTSGRLNGVVRMKRPDALFPFPVTDAGPQAIVGLNYLDTVRSQRGGASVDQNDADRQLMMSSATAAAGAMENAERMAGFYARNLVNTLLKNTYQLIHKKLRYEYTGTIGAKLRGKWQEVKPSEWQERTHMEVTSGMTTSERTNKIMGLNQVINELKSAMMAGGEGVITDKSKLYSAYADYIRAAELGQPEEYLIDPRSDESKQAQKAAAKSAEYAQGQMDRMAQMQQEIENQKLQLDRYKVDKALEFKYYDANLDAEVSEAKLVTDSVVKLKTVNKGGDT